MNVGPFIVLTGVIGDIAVRWALDRLGDCQFLRLASVIDPRPWRQHSHQDLGEVRVLYQLYECLLLQ